jgi:hypothetical protein
MVDKLYIILFVSTRRVQRYLNFSDRTSGSLEIRVRTFFEKFEFSKKVRTYLIMLYIKLFVMMSWIYYRNLNSFEQSIKMLEWKNKKFWYPYAGHYQSSGDHQISIKHHFLNTLRLYWADVNCRFLIKKVVFWKKKFFLKNFFPCISMGISKMYFKGTESDQIFFTDGRQIIYHFVRLKKTSSTVLEFFGSELRFARNSGSNSRKKFKTNVFAHAQFWREIQKFEIFDFFRISRELVRISKK